MYSVGDGMQQALEYADILNRSRLSIGRWHSSHRLGRLPLEPTPHDSPLPMTPHQFIARWQAADLSERAACQSHFADLCSVLDQPKASDVDPTGAWYAFEKGVDTSEGRKGWADVWLSRGAKSRK